MRHAVALLALTTCTASLLAAPAASAQAGDADALFRQGRQAAERGDYDTACARFQESFKADPATGTLLNLGDCEEHRDHLATALRHYQTAMGKLTLNDDRLSIVNERVTSLRGRAARVFIKLDSRAPSSTVVTLDGTQVPPARLAESLTVDAGQHTIVVRADGYADNTFGFDAKDGRTSEVEVAPGDKSAGVTEAPTPPASDEPAPAPAPAAEEAPSSSRKTIGFVIGGIGLAGLAVGGVTGAMAIGKESTRKSNCDASDVCNQTGYDAAQSGKTLAGISTYAFVAGGVGLAAGLFLVLTAPSSPSTSPSPPSSLSILPSIAPGGGGLLVRRAF
jgi:hypothetical protein